MKLLSVVLVLLACSGCVAPEPQARIRIAGGERVVVNLRGGKVEGSQSKFAQVLGARLMVNAEKHETVYQFGLAFEPGSEPTKIVVEDVTEDHAEVLFKDDKPQLKDSRWITTTAPVDINSPSLKWLHDIDDSFRVYRFSITLRDGQQISLLNAAIYLGFFKTGLMQTIKPPEAPAKSDAEQTGTSSP
ncbi:MAG: hypothetical protein QM790_18000 [Nibricoccus sp.]